MDTVLCDGCGQPATPEHIARRLRRLELATRFRPIHIGVLFLSEAPPLQFEDYFYAYDAERARARSGPSQAFFTSLIEGVGIAREEGKSEEAHLGEFQKRGFFLADALECPREEMVRAPGEGGDEAGDLNRWRRLAPTLARRIQFSYKPKHVVLLSLRLRPLVPILLEAGLQERLLLDQGLPLDLPDPQNPAAQARFRQRLAEILAHAAPAQGN